MLDILNENNILLNENFSSKEEAIIASGQVLVDNGYVYKEYIDSMLERDKKLSVYLGNNVAIPHGLYDSEPYIIKSGVSIIQVPNGVKFIDEIAYIVIGIAGKNNTHIDILSKIATIISEEENVNKIRKFKNKKDILDIFINN